MAYTCAKPPSTNNSVPVMWLLSLDARNTTALAISLGVPSLPRGTLLEIIFTRCSPAPVEATRSFSPGVSMGLASRHSREYGDPLGRLSMSARKSARRPLWRYKHYWPTILYSRPWRHAG